MTDWILKKCAEGNNYAVVAVGRLIAENKLAVIVNDEIKIVNITNPIPTGSYDVLIYGYIKNDLSKITQKVMRETPSYWFDNEFDIPFCYISPNDRTKIKHSKGYKLISFDCPDFLINLKLNTFYPSAQPLFVLDEIDTSTIDSIKGKTRKKKPKYTCFAMQLGT